MIRRMNLQDVQISLDYWGNLVDTHETKRGCDYTNALRMLADRIDQLEAIENENVEVYI